jgi:hypothetical protein
VEIELVVALEPRGDLVVEALVGVQPGDLVLVQAIGNSADGYTEPNKGSSPRAPD